jgi:transposase
MSGRKIRKYEVGFKRDAVRLANESGKADSAVERDLGVYQGAIRTWRKELGRSGEDAFPGKGKLHAHDEEFRRLRRELADVKMERDILKKAMAIFSNPRK